MDQPENLQVIKDEPITPPHSGATDEMLTSPNIKKRLNQHLKLRLQQDAHHNAERHSSPNSSGDMAYRKDVPKESSPPKRRTYQKRADKANANDTPSPQRKYKKHKLKAAKGVGGAALLRGQGDTSDGAISESAISLVGAERGSGAEDEGSLDGCNDLEGKSGASPNKEKCPDVLGLVLSMKKRTLLQQPEVQEFMRQLMEAIKS